MSADEWKYTNGEGVYFYLRAVTIKNQVLGLLFRTGRLTITPSTQDTYR